MKITALFTARLKRHISCVSAGVILCCGLVATAQNGLPPDVQADQYLLAAMAKMKNGETASAVFYFQKIEALNVTVPNEFHFYYGRCLAQSQNYPKAIVELTAYVKAAGRAGKFYQEALQLLNSSTEGNERQQSQIAQAQQEKSAKNTRIKALKEALGKLGGETGYEDETTSGDYRWYATTSGAAISFHASVYRKPKYENAPYYSMLSEFDLDIENIAEVNWKDEVILKSEIEVKNENNFSTDKGFGSKKESKFAKVLRKEVPYKFLNQIKEALKIQKNYSDITKLDIQSYENSEINKESSSTLRPNEPATPGLWTNSIGMVFAPVPGTGVMFCIWDTRVKDYQAYAEANSRVDDAWKNPGYIQSGTHPVVQVGWKGAKAFCKWLSHKEGINYRLPTDAEWSIAVGLENEVGSTPQEKDGGIKNVYPWGTSWPPPPRAGNFDPYLGVDTFVKTSPVGSFAANQFGLFDMGGNVYQMCDDKYEVGSAESVYRGSSFDCRYKNDMLSSHRNKSDPDDEGGNLLGFRCVLVGSSSR